MTTSKSVLALLLIATVATASPVHKQSGVSIPQTPRFNTDDAKEYGRQLAFYMDRYDHGWIDEVSQGTMTLFDASGDSVRRSYSRLTLERVEEGDKIIIRFLSPADIKGVAALTHENPGSSDDNWLYLPANKRVRRISGANNTASFQGTEFTYEDLATIDPREYQWRFLEQVMLDRDGAQLPVYKLNGKPTYKDTGYSHIVLYVHREHWRQERIEYFDQAGQLLKTRDSSDWRLMHGRFWRPARIEMVNHQTGKRTLLEQPKLFLNLALYTSTKTGKPRNNLSEDYFTTRAIQF